RDGYFFHGGAQILQTLGRLAYRSVDAFFRLWPSKAFLHDAYPQTFYSLAKNLCVSLGAHPLLSAIDAVVAGNDLEQQGAFVHGIGHGAYVVEGVLDAQYARIGNQAIGGFVAHKAAKGRRHAYRSGLVCPNGHVDFVCSDKRSTAVTGSARGVAGCSWIVDRTGVGSRAIGGKA